MPRGRLTMFTLRDAIIPLFFAVRGEGGGQKNVRAYLELSGLPECVAKVIVRIGEVRLQLDGVTKRPDRQILTPAPNGR